MLVFGRVNLRRHRQNAPRSKSKKVSDFVGYVSEDSVGLSLKTPYPPADRFGFWFHALPPDVVALTLAELHAIVNDSWLTRHDEAIQSEVSSRRPGRPPSKREVELRALKPQEEEEYRSGIGEYMLRYAV